MTTPNDAPSVIFTDDGWILSAANPPLTVDDLRANVVDSHAWPGGALWWSIGDHEVYHYETEIGEMLGAESDGLDEDTYSFVHSNTPGVMDTISQNVRALIQECGGPLTALSTLCREAGLQFFPRVRMNSHYEIDPRNPAYGRFRREHPNLLIGQPSEDLPEGSVHWGLRTGKDYAFPEVREYMASIIFETFERFDVDGVELDFMRHPGFFRPDQAFQNRYLMTDLIERVRRRLDEVAAERNDTLKLAVRVPPTLYDSARTGLDVEQWIRRELVDIVAVGGGFIPFETPVREFVEAAKGADCLIYGCIEATRHIDDAAIRALAARWISHGAAGVYLYNFYTMYPEWNRRIAQDLSDPRRLDRLDKRYELDRAGPLHPTRGHGGAFRYASPSSQLPVTLRPAVSGGPRFTVEITDNLESSVADGALDRCSITLRLEDIHPQDAVEVIVNGTPLARQSGKDAACGWTRLGITPQFWMSYPAYPEQQARDGMCLTFHVEAPPLRQGHNAVEVRLAPHRTDADVNAVLTNVEVDVIYKQ